MREVAVTEGDKVAAEAQLGYSVNTCGIGDLAARIHQFTDAEADTLVQEYRSTYTISPDHDRPDSLRVAAKIELGMRAFLEERADTVPFTDNFPGPPRASTQLPGIATQRLIGRRATRLRRRRRLEKPQPLVRTYEGSWPHGLPGGTSFMEDYTYDLATPQKGPRLAHAGDLPVHRGLETLARSPPPSGIGGKDDPARLVFTSPQRPPPSSPPSLIWAIASA